MKESYKIYPNIKGFTLVELMITIFISSLLTVAFYGTYIMQRSSYAAQGQVAEMQQNIRAGLDTMILDLRLAGYDPQENNVASITSALASSLSFTADLDDDGSIDDNGSVDTPPLASEPEHYAYDLNGTTLRRSATRDDSITDFQPVADNIEQIEFAYLLDGGGLVNDATGNEANIRAIRLSILARSKTADNKYNDTNTYTTAFGTNWGPYGDGFRRRLIITQIELRNMGLE